MAATFVDYSISKRVVNAPLDFSFLLSPELVEDMSTLLVYLNSLADLTLS